MTWEQRFGALVRCTPFITVEINGAGEDSTQGGGR